MLIFILYKLKYYLSLDSDKNKSIEFGNRFCWCFYWTWVVDFSRIIYEESDYVIILIHYNLYLSSWSWLYWFRGVPIYILVFDSERVKTILSVADHYRVNAALGKLAMIMMMVEFLAPAQFNLFHTSIAETKMLTGIANYFFGGAEDEQTETCNNHNCDLKRRPAEDEWVLVDKTSK